MKCRDIEGDLSAYVAEEAPSDLRRSIKAHLKGCKRCRARVEGLKAEKGGQKKVKEVVEAPSEETMPPQRGTASSSPSIIGILSALWRRPVEMTVTVVLICGTFFLYQRGASDLKSDFSVAENVAPPVAEALTAFAENHGSEQDAPIPPPLPPQTAPVAPPSLPMKVHQVTTQSLSKEAQRQVIPSSTPAIKLLLISRNIKEAADTVASQGKVLSKHGDEMEAKVVLLIPAERYETLSESLQSLGLVKDLSEKPPPTEGSLKVEVTIE
jgi:hypothetical protein